MYVCVCVCVCVCVFVCYKLPSHISAGTLVEWVVAEWPSYTMPHNAGVRVLLLEEYSNENPGRMNYAPV